MSPVVRNFITPDTRALEVASSIAMLIIGVVFLFQIDTDQLENYVPLWGILCILVQSIQLVAIAFHPHQLYARIASLWGAGSIWVFFALNKSSSTIEMTIMMVIGVSCFVAFVINTIIVSEHKNKDREWTQ